MSQRRNNRARRQNNRRPQTKNPRLFNATTLRFETSFLTHEYDAQELSLRPGEVVIAETSRGPCPATVTAHVQRRLVPAGDLPRIVRKATASDLRKLEENREREESAYRHALERIRARRLPMKLIRTQIMHDGSKIVFFFNADGRVDFRGLVRDLAQEFRTRIEMHQIGVRDGARMLGGIGPCGRELCCSTFLDHFAPVSIRMAKEQGLTLNPKKVSGMCGRLMCCLVYEQQLYKKQRRRMPRPKQRVHTRQGDGEILTVDVLNAQLLIELEDMSRKTFALDEVIVLDSQDEAHVDTTPPVEEEYFWDDAGASDGDRSSERPRSSNRRRRRKRKPSRKKNQD